MGILDFKDFISFVFTELLTIETWSVIIKGLMICFSVVIDAVALKKAWEMLS